MYFSSILWIMGTRVSIISLPNINEREKFKYTFYILHMNYMFFAHFEMKKIVLSSLGIYSVIITL